MAASSGVDLLASEYGLVDTYVEHRRNDRDINTLWRTVLDALEAGLLDAESFFMVAEAGTGKTLTAELAIVDSTTAVKREMRVYLVPYRSLAEEKTKTFLETIGETFDLAVESSLGGDRMEPSELFAADILVMTYEKFDYDLRNHVAFVNEIGLVVIDEFHTLGKGRRASIWRSWPPSSERSIRRFESLITVRRPPTAMTSPSGWQPSGATPEPGGNAPSGREPTWSEAVN